MSNEKRRSRWQALFWGCCLAYWGVTTALGLNDFGRIHREYRLAGEQLEAGRVRDAARRELFAECLREAAMRVGAPPGPAGRAAEEGCDTGPAVLAAREWTVAERLADEHTRAGRKLLLFYIFFTVIFLVAPPALLYGAVVLVRNVHGAVKVVR